VLASGDRRSIAAIPVALQASLRIGLPVTKPPKALHRLGETLIERVK